MPWTGLRAFSTFFRPSFIILPGCVICVLAPVRALLFIPLVLSPPTPVLLPREARLGWISRSGHVRGVRDRYSDQRKRESLRRSLPETRELRQFTLARLRRTNIPSNFHPAVNSHDIRQVIRDDTPNDLFPNGDS